MNKYVTNYHFYTNYRNINFISQHLNDTILNSYFNHCYRQKKKKNIEKKQQKKQTNKRMFGTSTLDSSFCIISTLEYNM